jgi:Mg-chelatase subunit ChlD
VWLTELLIVCLSFAVAGIVYAVSDTCDEQTVEVTAAPSVAPALKEAASAWTVPSDLGDICASVHVTVRPSVKAADELAGSGVDPPDLWIPDSSQWLRQLRRDTSGEDTPIHSAWVSPSIASSPIVLAASPDDAASLVKTAAGGWSGVLSGDAGLAVMDPTTRTEGLLTLAAAQETMGGESGSPTQELVGRFVDLSSRTLSSETEAVAQAKAKSLSFPASEQSVIRANAGPGPDRIQSVYPRGEGMSLDFPVVRFVPPTQEPAHFQAVQAFVSSLYGPVSQRKLRATGLRTADGGAFPTTVGFDGIAPTAVIHSPTQVGDQEVIDAQRVWAAAQRRNRTLVVVDVSGSMAENGGEKIRFAAAAAKDAVDYLPDDAHLGLWAFSKNLNGSSPWRALSSLGTLGSADDPQAHRQALRAATDQLPSLTDPPRDTALYQATWDAYETVSDGYDPKSLDSVVVVTDGSDTASGLTREELLGRLGDAKDSARPVPIFTVAIGPDADRTTLQQISGATGGSSYTVDTPSDIRDIFIDAVIEARK